MYIIYQFLYYASECVNLCVSRGHQNRFQLGDCARGIFNKKAQ
jgi:hypothetical protein